MVKNVENVLKLVLKVVFSVAFLISITLNFNQYNANQTLIAKDASINTGLKMENSGFTINDRRYENAKIQNFYLTKDGKVVAQILAEDAVTKDSITFASSATVQPAKWDDAKWGEAKWE